MVGMEISAGIQFHAFIWTRCCIWSEGGRTSQRGLEYLQECKTGAKLNSVYKDKFVCGKGTESLSISLLFVGVIDQHCRLIVTSEKNRYNKGL